jgi:ribosome biogenesis GTPase
MYSIGRVISQAFKQYKVAFGSKVLTATVSGKFRYMAESKEAYPAVGDFVVLDKISGDSAQISEVLPRYSHFSRKANSASGTKFVDGILESGATEAQVLASNIDTVFVVCGLDGDFNLSRLERYMLNLREIDAHVVIVLNKSDLCEDAESMVNKVTEKFVGCDVVAISALYDDAKNKLAKYLVAEQTLLFVGSSGVGKSTLLNSIFGMVQQLTKATSQKTGKGMHTTTSRQMFLHRDGYMIIDVPGIRELQLWTNSETVNDMFSDVIELFSMCRFSNCKHDTEPECAVKQALESGELSLDRYEAYHKYMREVKRLEARKMQRENKRRRNDEYR